MRYLLIDNYEARHNGEDPCTRFETLEEVGNHIRDIARDFIDDGGGHRMEEWEEGLQLFVLAEELPIKIEQTISVNFDKPTPPSKPVENVTPLRDYTGSYGRIDNPSRY
jgi:hypothetical protein